MAFCIQRDGSNLMTVSKESIKLWDVSGKNISETKCNPPLHPNFNTSYYMYYDNCYLFRDGTRCLVSYTYIVDGKRYYTCIGNTMVSYDIGDIGGNKKRRKMSFIPEIDEYDNNQGNKYMSFDVSPDENHLVYYNRAYMCKIVNVNSGDEIMTVNVKKHDAMLSKNHCMFHPGGTKILTTNYIPDLSSAMFNPLIRSVHTSCAEIYDIETNHFISKYDIGYMFSFDKTGNMLLSANINNDVVLVDVRTDEVLKTDIGNDCVDALPKSFNKCLSPDGKYFVLYRTNMYDLYDTRKLNEPVCQSYVCLEDREDESAEDVSIQFLDNDTFAFTFNGDVTIHNIPYDNVIKQHLVDDVSSIVKEYNYVTDRIGTFPQSKTFKIPPANETIKSRELSNT